MIISIVLATFTAIMIMTILVLLAGDSCYYEKYPNMRYGWNGTEHKDYYVNCLEDKGLNPDSIPLRLLGRDLD